MKKGGTKGIRGNFPAAKVNAMHVAIMCGGEGEVSKQLRNARQVWRGNLYMLLASIDVQAAIRKVAHPAAYKILCKYGKECTTRFRPYNHFYDGRLSGNGTCTMNAISEALETGMELWSGYACFVGNTSWHLWNVDAQGFVYDPTYSANSVFCRYYGIRLDPYVAYEALVAQSGNTWESMFLYWNFFHAFQEKCKRLIQEEITDEAYLRVAEYVLKNIALA